MGRPIKRMDRAVRGIGFLFYFLESNSFLQVSSKRVIYNNILGEKGDEQEVCSGSTVFVGSHHTTQSYGPTATEANRNNLSFAFFVGTKNEPKNTACCFRYY